MNTEDNGNLDSLIQEKLDTDTDFQDSLVDLSEDEKDTAINTKRSEVINQEYSSLLDKAKKDEELASNYKIRAEKAEGKNKKPDGDTTPTNTEDKTSELSTKELYALVEAKIEQEDIDEVLKASKLLGKTISETLQDDTFKSIIEKRVEYRATAKATNTSAQRPSSKKVTDNEVVAQANKGEFPDKGSDEADQLFWARRGGKR